MLLLFSLLHQNTVTTKNVKCKINNTKVI